MLKTVSSITNAIGALNYKGTWNASTNTPTLADGTGAKGDYYVVSTAGTQTFDGILLFFGAGDWIVYNGAVWQRVEGGSDGNFSNVTLNSTDAGATAGPLLDLYRNSASPAASDTIGEIEFNGQDSAGNKQQYALIHGSILSPTSTTEQGQIHFETATAGALTEKMIIGTTNLVVNEIGAVFNVRIEGDTDANLFYTDATNDRIGVGTISPATKLAVNGAVSGASFIPSGSSVPTNGLYLPAANSLGFSTNSTKVATIDALGNLGIGATPSASNLPTIQSTYGLFTGDSQVNIQQNAYYNSGFLFTGTGYATQYQQIGGEHKWKVSTASGVANGAITFNQAMLIDTSSIVTMSAYGAGAATFSAAGVISSVSDETWKIKDGVPTNPDVMLQKLEPGYWFYNEEKAPTFGQDRQLGFYAQNVHEAIGEEAAPTPEKYKDEDGNDTDVSKPWGYYDRSVLAVAVMSLKNALATIEELKQRIETLETK